MTISALQAKTVDITLKVMVENTPRGTVIFLFPAPPCTPCPDQIEVDQRCFYTYHHAPFINFRAIDEFFSRLFLENLKTVAFDDRGWVASPLPPLRLMRLAEQITTLCAW